MCRMQRDLNKPFDKARSHPASLHQGTYALSAWDALRVVTQRQLTLVLRNRSLILGRFIQVGQGGHVGQGGQAG